MTNQLSDFRFAVSPEASASIHDNGIVILNLRSGRLYTSNETGASIWRRVERQLPLETITGEIGDEYQLARSAAHQHVSGFLAELEKHSLIRREVAQ